METLKSIRAWTDVLKCLKDHRCQPRLLYPEKLSITIDGKSKIFHVKATFKQYLYTNPALQKVLEGQLQSQEVNYNHQNTRNK